MDKHEDLNIQKDKALLECEERYRALFEKVDHGIFIYDLETMLILDANSAMSATYGYSYDELVGLNCLELSAEVENSLKSASAANEDGRFKVKTRWHKKKDGSLFPLELDGYRFVWDGKIVGCAVVKDISERLQAEQALAAEKDQLAVTLRSIAEGVITTDTHGNIVLLNKAAEALTGWSAHEAAGRPLLEVLHVINQSPPQSFENLVEKILETGAIVDSTTGICLAAKSGRETTIALSGAPIYANENQAIGVVLVLRDVTEKHKLEELQQKAQQQKLESIGLLAGGIAHDFNNMLGVILGHAELALMKTDPGTPFVENLEVIQAAANRSANLTQQLLTYARKQMVSPAVLSLNNALAGMLKVLQGLIGENIHLSWNPGTNLWNVKIDPSQLDQILTNLCINARDAIEGPGKITLATQNCSIAEGDRTFDPELQPGDYVRLSVFDNGQGIDQEHLDQIFEPFFTTKEFGRGTGLGLATVFGAVKQNHGFIEVASEPGQGTVFHIYLPRQHASVKAVEETTAQAPSQGEETVLLVEDDQMLLSLTKSILEESGYRVLDASTGDHAIALVKEYSEPIHLLLTDIVLPEMNGRDLRDILQDMCPEMKVIFMSGYTADIIAEQGMLEEGTHFLQKPVSLEALTSKVREVLGQE